MDDSGCGQSDDESITVIGQTRDVDSHTVHIATYVPTSNDPCSPPPQADQFNRSVQQLR